MCLKKYIKRKGNVLVIRIPGLKPLSSKPPDIVGEIHGTKQFLVLHCLATKLSHEVHAEDVKRWHMAPPPHGYGWSRPGYVKILLQDGAWEYLVDKDKIDTDMLVEADEMTWGVKGYNSVSEHWVICGGLGEDGNPADTLTDKQYDSLSEALNLYTGWYNDTSIKIVGHYQLDPINKAFCPGWSVPDRLTRMCIDDKFILKL